MFGIYHRMRFRCALVYYWMMAMNIRLNAQ